MAAVGPLALRIDHIGSTSVPGFAAKDVIDVQVTVADEEALRETCRKLGTAGFPSSADLIYLPAKVWAESTGWSVTAAKHQ